MRIPNAEYADQPWRIHEITADFRLYDVWALPTPGGPDDFSKLVQQTSSGDTGENPSWLARMLFAIRWKLGEIFGWDDPDRGIGQRVTSLRDRLPDDLRNGPTGPAFDRLPFTAVFQTGNEMAAEMANSTMHGVMHLSWVRDDTGGYHGQMAVLVRPNGVIGTAYMAAIAPFRHLFVYPPLMRGIEKEWQGDSTH